MELLAIQLVGFGGAIGAILRYLVGEVVPAESIPLDTLTVNVLGSFALGLVTAIGASTEIALLVGTGTCGSFTTYSSFSVETVRLWERGKLKRAVGYAFGTFALCALAVGLAWVLAAAL